MRKAVVLLTLVFAVAFMGVASAVEVEVFNDTFVRGTGSPVTEFRNFDIKGIGGPAILKITNGADDDTYEKVSSSVIKVNGVTVADSSNFNQNVFYLDKEITLYDGSNTVEVLLKSKPGGAINLRVIKNVEAEASSVIGPDGGVVEVTDPSSPIYGTKVEIPEGALNNGNMISLNASEFQDLLPEDYFQAGKCVDFKPDGISFLSPVTVFLPYNDTDNDGYIDGTDTPETLVSGISYNTITGEWENMNAVSVDLNNNLVEIATNHFSPKSASGSANCNFTFKEFNWLKADWTSPGVSEFICKNAQYDKKADTVTLVHESKNGKWRGSEIQTIAQYGYGTYEATITVPKAGDQGVVAAFFLYYKTDDKVVDEIDFEMLPGKNAVQIGTYNDWPEDVIPAYARWDCKRDVKTLNADDLGDDWWGKEHTFTIIKKPTETILKIDGNDVLKTSCSIFRDGYYGAHVDDNNGHKQHIMFNIWTPNYSQWDVGGNPYNVSEEVKMVIHDISFTKDTDGDSIPDDGDNSGIIGDNPCTGGNAIDCDDNCPTTPNSDQSDSDNDGIGDACETQSEELFTLFQSIPTIASGDWEDFTIDGETYLVNANSWYMTTYRGGSKIYKFDGVQFVEFQELPTMGAVGMEVFTIDGVQYLAAANYYNGSSFVHDSQIFRWDGTKFVEHQRIPTHGAMEWESFTIGDDTFLVVANSGSHPSGPYSIESKIYRWNGSSFVEFQSILTHNAMDWKSFVINGETYLAVANYWDSSNSTVNLFSKIYKWNGSAFVEFQSILTYGAKGWECFTINGDTYLVVANYRDNSYNYDVDSVIYKWDGSEFVVYKIIDTNGASHWEHFTIGSDHYLALAKHYDSSVSSYNNDAAIYKWMGTQFEPIQYIPSNGPSNWEHFTIDGKTYLALPGSWDGSTSNLISKIFVANTDLNAGLVAYYPFNGNANDESGNGLDGTVYGSTLTTDRLGNANSAYSFDGVDDYIVFKNEPILNADFSISLWFQTSTSNDSNKADRLFGNRQSNIDSYGVRISQVETNSDPRPGNSLSSGIYNGSSYEVVTSQNPINDGNWHVAVVVYDTTNSIYALYLDGNLIDSKVADFVMNPIHPFIAGASPFGYVEDDGPAYWTGKLDDIRIYNRALSASEIQDLYNAEAPPTPPVDLSTGLVAHYPFNGNANDASGNGYHGIEQNGVTYADGVLGQTAQLDGINDYISIDNRAINGLDSLSLSFWAKTTDNGTGDTVFSSANYQHHNEFLVCFDLGRIRHQIKYTETRTINSYNDNQWHNFVITRQSSVVKLYADGILAHEWTTAETGALIVDDNGFVFGADQDCVGGCFTDPTEFYKGLLDEVRIYNRVLKETEVQALYNLQ